MMVNINDKYKLDEKDQKILHMLSDDSRLLWKEIGGNLGISANAARRRVLNLIDCGIIKRFTIEIDYDLIEEG